MADTLSLSLDKWPKFSFKSRQLISFILLIPNDGLLPQTLHANINYLSQMGPNCLQCVSLPHFQLLDTDALVVSCSTW